MNAHTYWVVGGAAAILAGHCLLAQAAAAQNFALRDAHGLIAPESKVEAAKYLGRESVRITVDGEDHHALVLLPGTDFQDGVIEADIALKITTPPGVRNPGFVGIAFRARADASHYELFYLRPGNAQAPDQAMRNHTVQYLSAPDFSWYRLRREWPSVYESHADITTESWTHVRIEVAGRAAKLFLNGSAKPSLVIDGMKGEDLHGAVGLWGYTDQEAYFSNVRIDAAAPQALANGSIADGSWTMHFSSDAGPMDGSMQLHTDGSHVSGTWSGTMGQNRPVIGTWRGGYVDLSFPGEWPADNRDGAPGPVIAYLAGWIDGGLGKGRMRVEGRADGVWSATRTPQGN
jgi:hypothetical protein